MFSVVCSLLYVVGLDWIGSNRASKCSILLDSLALPFESGAVGLLILCCLVCVCVCVDSEYSTLLLIRYGDRSMIDGLIIGMMIRFD